MKEVGQALYGPGPALKFGGPVKIGLTLPSSFLRKEKKKTDFASLLKGRTGPCISLEGLIESLKPLVVKHEKENNNLIRTGEKNPYGQCNSSIKELLHNMYRQVFF